MLRARDVEKRIKKTRAYYERTTPSKHAAHAPRPLCTSAHRDDKTHTRHIMNPRCVHPSIEARILITFMTNCTIRLDVWFSVAGLHAFRLDDKQPEGRYRPNSPPSRMWVSRHAHVCRIHSFLQTTAIGDTGRRRRRATRTSIRPISSAFRCSAAAPVQPLPTVRFWVTSTLRHAGY